MSVTEDFLKDNSIKIAILQTRHSSKFERFMISFPSIWRLLLSGARYWPHGAAAPLIDRPINQAYLGRKKAGKSGLISVKLHRKCLELGATHTPASGLVCTHTRTHTRMYEVIMHRTFFSFEAKPYFRRRWNFHNISRFLANRGTFLLIMWR